MQAAQDWLFDPAIWAPAAVVLIGVAVLLLGLTRGLPRARLAGLIVAVLGVGWYLLAGAVETWTEQAEKRTEEIVNAYDDADWATLGTLIDDETHFYDIAGDDLVTAAEATHKSIGHESLGIKGLSAERDPVGIRVRFNVTSNQSNGPARLTTAWEFDYRVRDGALYLRELTPLNTPVIDAETVRERVVRD